MLAKLALCAGSPATRLVPAHPPTPLIKSELATPDPTCRPGGLVTAPVFGRGGALSPRPLPPDARLYYHAMTGLHCADRRAAEPDAIAAHGS
jgi:hypothetical protein